MIIALHGRARSGKDTAGAYLQRLYGLHRYAFADPIRAAMRAAFGLTDWHFDAGKEIPLDRLGKSPRQLMQLFGTEFCRQTIHPDCWIMVADQKCVGITNLVITDCRFVNEARWVWQRGGYIVQINRPDAPSVTAHSSEEGLPSYFINFTIENTGSIGDLYTEVDKVVHAIRTGT